MSDPPPQSPEPAAVPADMMAVLNARDARVNARMDARDARMDARMEARMDDFEQLIRALSAANAALAVQPPSQAAAQASPPQAGATPPQAGAEDGALLPPRSVPQPATRLRGGLARLSQREESINRTMAGDMSPEELGQMWTTLRLGSRVRVGDGGVGCSLLESARMLPSSEVTDMLRDEGGLGATSDPSAAIEKALRQLKEKERNEKRKIEVKEYGSFAEFYSRFSELGFFSPRLQGEQPITADSS